MDVNRLDTWPDQTTPGAPALVPGASRVSRPYFRAGAWRYLDAAGVEQFLVAPPEVAELSLNQGTLVWDFNLGTENAFTERAWDNFSGSLNLTQSGNGILLPAALAGRTALLSASIMMDVQVSNRMQTEIRILSDTTIVAYGAAYSARDVDQDRGGAAIPPRKYTIVGGEVITLTNAFEQDGTSGNANNSVEGGSFLTVHVL